MRSGWFLSGLLVALGLMPGLIALGSGGVAAILGCRLNRITPAPCLAFGSDWGGWLHAAAGLAWLTVFGVPLVLAGFAWAMALATIGLRRRLRR